MPVPGLCASLGDLATRWTNDIVPVAEILMQNCGAGRNPLFAVFALLVVGPWSGGRIVERDING